MTQYECDNLMMPVQDCLQYHTAQSGGRAHVKKMSVVITMCCEGTLASFNYDTSSSTVATSQTHLSSQWDQIIM